MPGPPAVPVLSGHLMEQPFEASRNNSVRSSARQTDVSQPDVEKRSPAEPVNGGPRGGPASTYDDYQPKSLKFWLLIVAMFLALFLVALDRTIIATAIPRITDEFKSLGDIGWYGSAYMLTTSASQLVFGRIYKFYDLKLVFLSCVVIFEAGSALCGAAPTSTSFIVGRAIAGFASAGIFSGCMMIMVPLIPLHKRPVFQGMFGMVFGVASIMGPLIGGGFTGGVSWRWCFYINLPVGGFTLAFMLLFWKPKKGPKSEPVPWKTHILRLDPLGSFFYLPGIISLLLALQWGGSTYAWSNWRIVLLFVLFGVLILAFAAVQILMPETATVPPKVITQRSVLCGTLFTFFMAGSMMLIVYYVSIWFQTVQGVDPLQSGIYTIPLVLSSVVASLGNGFITQKTGYYVPGMLLCPCIMAVGEGLMSTFRPGTGSPHWIAYQFLTGLGLGLGMQQGGLAVQTVLPPDQVSTGLAIGFFAQQLGGAVFTSAGQTVLGNVLGAELSRIDGLDPHLVVASGATDVFDVVPPRYRAAVAAAYNFALTRVFLMAMGLCFACLLAALGMEWRSIKKGRQGGGGGPVGPASSQKPERGVSEVDTRDEEKGVQEPSTTKVQARRTVNSESGSSSADDNEPELAPGSQKGGITGAPR